MIRKSMNEPCRGAQVPQAKKPALRHVRDVAEVPGYNSCEAAALLPFRDPCQ